MRLEDKVAHIVLSRPERGNAITLEMPAQLASLVERANLDPAVHVIALSGAGKGFCAGYDLIDSAQSAFEGKADSAAAPGSPLDPAVIAQNHNPSETWDPMVDYSMMSRNVRHFMSLFRSSHPKIMRLERP